MFKYKVSVWVLLPQAILNSSNRWDILNNSNPQDILSNSNPQDILSNNQCKDIVSLQLAILSQDISNPQLVTLNQANSSPCRDTDNNQLVTLSQAINSLCLVMDNNPLVTLSQDINSLCLATDNNQLVTLNLTECQLVEYMYKALMEESHMLLCNEEFTDLM